MNLQFKMMNKLPFHRFKGQLEYIAHVAHVINKLTICDFIHTFNFHLYIVYTYNIDCYLSIPNIASHIQFNESYIDKAIRILNRNILFM